MPNVAGVLGYRALDAFDCLMDLLGDKRRKGDGSPYIAALLHDTAEDQGGLERLLDIEAHFGSRVAQIVRECSDSLLAAGEAKAPWRERKERHLAELAGCRPSTWLVLAADKLHNARSMAVQCQCCGPQFFGHFRAGKEGIIWYMRAMTSELRRLMGDVPLMTELEDAVRQLEEVAAAA